MKNEFCVAKDPRSGYWRMAICKNIGYTQTTIKFEGENILLTYENKDKDCVHLYTSSREKALEKASEVLQKRGYLVSEIAKMIN